MPPEGPRMPKTLPETPAASSPGAVRRFVVADLGEARFGLEVGRVREVFPLPACARVPHAPAWVWGAVVRGGRLLTIVDLARFFDLSRPAAPAVCVRLDESELALGWAVAGVEVVEERQTVRSVDPRVALPDPAYVTESLLTPRFDFHRLDVARVVAGVRERF